MRALIFIFVILSRAIPVAAQAPTGLPRVVVLGDSLAVSPTAQLNFTTELQARADAAGVRVRISNASTWGDTTADGAGRSGDREVSHRLRRRSRPARWRR